MSKPPKLWATCIDAKGTKTLTEGEKYLIQPIGEKAKVIIWQGNRHHVLGNIVNKRRFETVKTMSKYNPTKKNKGIDDFANKLSGRDRVDSIKNELCATCGKKVLGFNDKLSEREYEISGMCQECQDSVFNI